MQSDLKFEFTEIVENFRFDGEFVKAEPYGCGHINDTFAVYFKNDAGYSHRYILQRINHLVFKNPLALMQNIVAVTGHLHLKISAAGGDPGRETLNLIPTPQGASCYQDSNGNYWRAYVFIENARTYQVVQDSSHFYHAGKAIGRFQKLMSDYPAARLYETIPDFHHTRKRFMTLMAAVEKDLLNRRQYVRPEIDFVKKRAAETSILVDLLSQGQLPLRVTHSDTKFNNVMIDDRTGEGICVIDLDTVMPGLSLYDFGDAIRFGSNPAAEDEKDLAKVYLQVELFEQFTKGYLETIGDFLTPLEAGHLPFAAKLMTLECGIRFLEDYLNGDIYFKTHRNGHNLDRARTQFKLVVDMEAKMDLMLKIVKQHYHYLVFVLLFFSFSSITFF